MEQHFHKQLTEEESYISLAIVIISYSLHSALKTSDCAKLSRQEGHFSEI